MSFVQTADFASEGKEVAHILANRGSLLLYQNYHKASLTRKTIMWQRIQDLGLS